MNSREDDQNAPILIVGCRRSGTTLLRTILEGHPRLLVHPDEPQFFLELYRTYGFSKMSAEAAVTHILEHPYCAPNLHQASFSSIDSKLDLVELVENYLRAWRAGQTDKRPVLKDPLFVFYLDTVSKLFPECIVINIVRDPRANVSSQRLRWPQFSVWTCAKYWKRAVRAALRWGAHHPHRYLTVSYEALVLDPESTVRQLCDELGLPYADDLISFRHEQVVFDADGSSRIKQFTAPDPEHQTLWKQRLSEEDVQLVEACCAQEMAELGYKPMTSNELSVSLQLRKVREQLAYCWFAFGKKTKNSVRLLKGQLQASLEKDGWS